ncbi:MAG: hypothetical protein RR986_06420 [Longicatena sp.]
MITQEPTKKMLDEYYCVYVKFKDKLTPNAKSGTELITYLQKNYTLIETDDKDAKDNLIYNITMNICNAEKLPTNTLPVPRTFYLENDAKAKKLYNQNTPRILIAIDTITSFFSVEESEDLYDELLAYRGLDDKDIKNYVCVSQYIAALKKFGKLQQIISKNIMEPSIQDLLDNIK